MTWRRFFGLAIMVPLLCAMTPAQAIVCGEPVRPGEQPWLVQVVKLDVYGRAYYGAGALICSGALLDDRNIVTAAHCLNKVEPAKLGVRVWTKAGLSDPYPVHSGGPVAGHPAADVAVLQLDKSIENAVPANWQGPAVEDPESGRGFIAGWGIVWPVAAETANRSVPRDGCALATGLKQNPSPFGGDVDLLEIGRCQKPSFFAPRTMMCAHGPATQPTGICDGDSGGPLTRRDSTGRATLIAIASEVDGLHRTDPESCMRNPGLFVAVAPLVARIELTIAELLKPSKSSITK